tara:strand:+ start:1104 stop:1421 length:318 start_codon:yes stop_codon:yes gene_type:complete
VSNLYINNDNLLSVENLKNAATDVFINDATVTAILKNSAGGNVTGQSWPLTLAFVSSSNGDYKGTLEDGLVLTEGTTYTAEINADAGNDQIANWSVSFTAKKRTT